MNKYKSSAQLKGVAKDQLFGHYGTTIGALLLVGIITLIISSMPNWFVSANSIPELIIYYLISFIISLFIGIFSSGEAFLYLKLTCGQNVSVKDVFTGFRVYPDKAIMIQLVFSLLTYICRAPMMIFYYLFLTTGTVNYMLFLSIFCVAGSAVSIVVGLMFSQAFYLLQDFPQYSAKDILKMSRQIMKGHKGRLFYISLSFLPLYLLGIFSFFIVYLWLMPYTNAVMANFYMDLMKNRSQVSPQQ